jgi:hypothetical protein
VLDADIDQDDELAGANALTAVSWKGWPVVAAADRA